MYFCLFSCKYSKLYNRATVIKLMLDYNVKKQELNFHEYIIQKPAHSSWQNATKMQIKNINSIPAGILASNHSYYVPSQLENNP